MSRFLRGGLGSRCGRRFHAARQPPERDGPHGAGGTRRVPLRERTLPGGLRQACGQPLLGASAPQSLVPATAVPVLCHPDPPVRADESPGRSRCSPAGNSCRHFPARRKRFLLSFPSRTPGCVTAAALPLSCWLVLERQSRGLHTRPCIAVALGSARGRTSRFGFPRLSRRDGGAGTKGPLRRTSRVLVRKGRSHRRLFRGAACVCVRVLSGRPPAGFRAGRQERAPARGLRSPEAPVPSAPRRLTARLRPRPAGCAT